MGTLEQVLQMPYAYAWLPAIVFFCVVGGLYWMIRPAPSYANASAGKEVQPIVTEKAKDLRNAFRRHGNPIEVHVATSDDKKDPAIGSVLDRSVGGMKLALYHKVETGTILSIRPVHADGMVPWVDLEVRSCRPSTEMFDQFDVGCQYVKSPPYSIQLLFG